jgi:hypothetical protein
MSCNYTIPLFQGMVLIARFGGLVVKVDAFDKTPILYLGLSFRPQSSVEDPKYLASKHNRSLKT